ncbi:hypothetical protein FSARC_14215 [Fusarium sarcochroum]|uniref:Mid2 domain-containing protein n=1 Tax=Fusarium sarcochroum TaxID=1208366 RepID=A0A8H4WQR1_9HYPO|nr:hypothetical protein FSARC_14215 [Fusarium sarcochroum]
MGSGNEFESGADFTQTAVIPLTTIFTPNEDCTAASAYDSTIWAGNQWAYQLDSGISKASCYPSNYKNYQYRSKLWYSPGQESDLSLFSPKSAPVLALESAGVTFPPGSTTTTSGTSSSASTTSSDSESPTNDTDGGSDGLGTGATAGIAVGAAIGGMLAIGLLWWLTKRYKVSRREKNVVQYSQAWSQRDSHREGLKPEEHTAAETRGPYEVDGVSRAELPS